MVLLAWGVNYQTAPLNVREKLAASKDQAGPLLHAICQDGIVSEAVLVSTCNRTEIYATVTNPGDTDYLEQQMLSLGSLGSLGSVNALGTLEASDLHSHSYWYYDEAAASHLMRVACGLNSMVLGEVEILGQIKQAYLLAKAQKTLGKTLNRLFQRSFYVAKTVRTQTEIGVNPLSVASIAVKLAERIFTDLKQATVLLIGAGDLIRLTATHLKQVGVHKLLLANRSLLAAEKLANALSSKTMLTESITVESFAVESIPLESLPQRLQEADIVIAGTSSVLPLIGKGMVEQALEKRKRRPILMIDLAVPRDIEPQVGALEDVYLYCIDDLKTMAEENRKLRQSAAESAEHIILRESETFMNWCKAQDSLATLKDFRAKFEQMSDELLAEACVQLQKGKTPEEVLKRYTAVLFNRLMHPPTQRLRKAGFQGDESILQFTRELFELNHEIINTS